MSNCFRAGVVIGITALGAGAAIAFPTTPLYIDDQNGVIGTVDLSTEQVTVIGYSGESLTDIGFTANGDMYGTSFDSLYSINKSTGAASLISSYSGIGNNGMNALVGSGSGLYGASYADQGLYSIGPSPFTVTQLTGSLPGVSAGDLAFGPSGNDLYETLGNGDLVKISISGSSFTSTVVGDTGNTAIYGLATGDDGVTYAISGTEIYTVNLSTAALTPLFDYGGQGLGPAYGTAFSTEAVPEPASSIALGLGLVGIINLRRRRH